MDHDFVPLTLKKEMWARMLMDVLQDHQIPYTAMPTIGAGMTAKAGKQEEYLLYVPRDLKAQAEALVDELFSGTETE